MGEKLEIPEMFAQYHAIFEEVGRESLEALFQKKFTIASPWQVAPRLEGTFDFVISLGSGNDNYQAVTAIGLSKSALIAILETEEPQDLLDIFGEVGNTYCGLLMDNEPISQYCGFLNQSVPQYANEAMYFPKVTSIHGTIHHQNHFIYMGFALRMVSKPF